MRILILSDVHANLAALEAVLQDAGNFDMIWSLGDIVGYGPDPNACITRLNDFEHLAIAGNHDWGVLGKIDLADFNPDARQANLWTREQLTPQSFAYLQSLPEKLIQGDFTLAHGSPRHPIWEYILHESIAKINFTHFETTFCLVGHTHVPIIFQYDTETSRCLAAMPPEREPFQLETNRYRYIINPGGVGQPRDGDPRAAYMLLDLEEKVFEYRRVSYDIAATQKKMRAAGLPFRLIARLELGW
ncbi:MAG: metallophosphoesterase family protein [Anaerolineae bacterium]|nr:metallophosphoesterase family protein [Anaerolineae bacterium]